VLIDGGADDAGEAAAPATFDGDLLEYISLQEVRAAIEALPSDLRTAVTLCDMEGFTYAEIADITGCPVGTVRSRIARCPSPKFHPHHSIALTSCESVR